MRRLLDRAGRTIPSTRASSAPQRSPIEAHVLALLPEIGRVHLDELPDEDPRAGIGLVPVPLGVRHGGADQVIHELELAADSDAELGKLGLPAESGAAVS